MDAALVIFPHQLFKKIPSFHEINQPIYLVEEQLFFHDSTYKIPFHKKKILLHRASMKAYQYYLDEKGYQVNYLDYQSDPEMNYLFKRLEKDGIENIYYADPVDFALDERLQRYSAEFNIVNHELNSPSFLNSKKSLKYYFQDNKGYRLTSFYINERKRLGILIKDGKPVGGRWTFDKYNRRKIPRRLDIPTVKSAPENPFIKEATLYVEKKFPHHPGSTDGFFYPVTHDDAELWLDEFLEKRFFYFGDYQDAIKKGEPFLFHSLLSSSLNIGLLTPEEVLLKVLSTKGVPLNSREGFIRQIIGWREFLRAVYLFEGDNLRTRNYLEFHQKMPGSVWKGETGLIPFDNTVKRVMENAYAHHIERLMILGNLMLLLEVNPDEVYYWFMTLFIDAYDWVMVPNVYGMSQYADGGLITTKPYISSCNYLLKMSDYPPGQWCEKWTSLFWRFIWTHQQLLEENPRLALLKNYLRDEKKIKKHLNEADNFLRSIKML
ncbi:MAG: cryptochrome/photolyase family protein [Methanobacteriaceae archaeon]|nr:cryptochrome/photolyase family protein [Methanobacteriaceae archaeon]